MTSDFTFGAIEGAWRITVDLMPDGTIHAHGYDHPFVAEWCAKHGETLTIELARVAPSVVVSPG